MIYSNYTINVNKLAEIPQYWKFYEINLEKKLQINQTTHSII